LSRKRQTTMKFKVHFSNLNHRSGYVIPLALKIWRWLLYVFVKNLWSPGCSLCLKGSACSCCTCR
jgi:hypothetical protein